MTPSSPGSPATGVPILAWCRTAVVPRHGAFRHHQPHTLAAPLVRHLLQGTGLPAEAVDALVLGNALGAGGNPARLTALQAGLPNRAATFSVDSQCSAGLDAINLAAALLSSGQADIVLAGGSEAWSRAPIRQHRPRDAGESAVTYERPAFAPSADDDPEPADAAAQHAARHGWLRSQQDEHARDSHRRAVAARALLRDEILALDGVDADAYPRLLDPALLRRMPVVVEARDDEGRDCSLSRLAIAPQADGAALLLMASHRACRRWRQDPAAFWLGGLQQGGDPRQPMNCALPAARALLQRHDRMPHALATVELHDAFAVQGLDFMQALGIDPALLNPHGGGLARGHPIGASGAIALVRVLATLAAQPQPQSENGGGTETCAGDRARLGLACIAAAGGLGSATLVARADASLRPLPARPPAHR